MGLLARLCVASGSCASSVEFFQAARDGSGVGCVDDVMAAFLIVRARDRLCALPLPSVIEIMRPLPITAHRSTVRSVLGVAVVRGAPSPVIDVSLLIGDTPGSTTRFVSLRVGDRSATLAVDDVVGVADLDTDTLASLPPLLADEENEPTAALGRRDGELIAILAASRFVPDDVWRSLSGDGC